MYEFYLIWKQILWKIIWLLLLAVSIYHINITKFDNEGYIIYKFCRFRNYMTQLFNYRCSFLVINNLPNPVRLEIYIKMNSSDAVNFGILVMFRVEIACALLFTNIRFSFYLFFQFQITNIIKRYFVFEIIIY